MTNQPYPSTRILSRILQAFMLALLCTPTMVAMQSAQAQTFTALHEFTGGADGGNPITGLTMDRGGNLYGTTSYLNESYFGTVFKLSHKNSGWILTTLHGFTGGSDGAFPQARVVFGPDGKLYGTSQGNLNGGNVFSLAPPATVCKSVSCPWTINVLHSFAGDDGWQPDNGDPIFDPAGNIYGTTSQGGGSGGRDYCEEHGCGVAYELSPSNGGWTETGLYVFNIGPTATPSGGMIQDSSGNLYGTTKTGGPYPQGTVYLLTPGSGSWSQTVLYGFTGQDDGCDPLAGLLADGLGNLFGATAGCGAGGGGTVFELSHSGGNWVYNLIYSFSGNYGPAARLTMDAAGNLYGTTIRDGSYGYGNVFKLTPSNGSWIYTSLHDFTGGVDGAYPNSNVIFDASGNLYGTAAFGGTGTSCESGCGVVWEIAP